MNKIISILICLVLLISCGGVTYATDVDKIQPDSTYQIGSATQPTIYTMKDGTVVVIPSGNIPGVYKNPVTSNIIDTTETKKIEETEKTETTEEKQEETAISTTEGIRLEDLVEEIFNLTNKERKDAGLNELTYNKGLQEAANTRAKEISTLFSHTRPDGSDCHTVVELEYYVTGENLIMADNPIATSENMMKEWMNSEGHRENILLPEYTSMAVGVTESDGVTYAVQIFMG